MTPRERILAAAAKFRPVKVSIPEAGEDLFVRAMSVGGVGRFQEAHAKDPTASSRAMIIECLCDENGARVLTDEDAAIVAEWPVTTLNALVDAISKATGLNDKEPGAVAGN